MALPIIFIAVLSMTSHALTRDSESVNSLAQCEAAIKEIERKDLETIVDDSPSRLYSTWLSQECEVRAGPVYIMKKYTFFENGTFLLLRYHYAEESCSIATHTVTIRGSVKLLGSSVVVSGATETRFHVDAINIVPLNRQVARKFGHRLNQTCGPQPKWRPYVPEVVYYEQQRSSATPLWQGPIYNSLQAHSSTKRRLGINCLEPFGIEFSELRLLRVQRKSLLRSSSVNRYHELPQFQLFLASPTANVRSRWSYKPTSLQSTPMVRADTASGCPICSGVSRSTELSPPLLHQTAALPALIGGYWHSESCESSEGGIWSRRQFQIHSGDRLWTGRWDYYDDPQCSTFLYAITAAGSYVQRAGRRHEQVDRKTFLNVSSVSRSLARRSVTDRPKDVTDEWVERSLTDGVHRLLRDEQPIVRSRFAAMLRDDWRHEASTRKPLLQKTSSILAGTTELDLHIAESILIPGDAKVSTRCSAAARPRSCVPRAIEAPSTLRLQAKLGVNWNGQYILLLGSRDADAGGWEAPLRQCAQISPRNSILRAHLRRSVGLRFGLLSSAASSSRIFAWFFPLLSPILLW
ncbi:PREDICTED: protein APCDD1-like [Vollenhovia emeryi]|uniref:protein APCDD1-like n=1 Tax=Vollenhovia emeryi TaxID=411798 RepID=UPI0005F3DEBD|nr:PREDICTED: protein APCDD1-like [Vollenhovia emeryi]XP_011869530.1 PREDICTED: protein APCDD1-like [Vollenhovia emeryi]